MLGHAQLSHFLEDIISLYRTERKGQVPDFLELRLKWEDRLEESSPEKAYLKKLEERFWLSSDEYSPFSPNLYLSIAELELSIRSNKCLKSLGIEYVGELIQHNEKELTEQPNFGKRSLREIKEVLLGMGLTLGMTLCGWVSPPQEEKIKAQLGKEPATPLSLKEFSKLFTGIKKFYAERFALEQTKEAPEYALKKEDWGTRFYEFSTDWLLNPKLGFPETMYLEKMRMSYLVS